MGEAHKSKTHFQGIRDESKSSFIRLLTLEILRESKHFLYSCEGLLYRHLIN